MVSGGHFDDDRGLRATNIFDPVSQTWTTGLPKMAQGRWYPTVTTLPDGRMVTVAGRDSASNVVLVPEIWEGNKWVPLPGASLRLPYYPYLFVGAETGGCSTPASGSRARWLDVDATGSERPRQVDFVHRAQAPVAVQPGLRLSGDVRDGEGARW